MSRTALADSDARADFGSARRMLLSGTRLPELSPVSRDEHNAPLGTQTWRNVIGTGILHTARKPRTPTSRYKDTAGKRVVGR